MRLGLTAATVVALTGGGLTAAGAGPGGSSEGSNGFSPAASCEAKVSTLASWIAAAPLGSNVINQSTDLRLVEGDWKALEVPDVQIPTLEIRARGRAFLFPFEEYQNPAALQRGLDEYAERSRSKGPQRIAVAIDRDAKWSAVSAAVTAAGAAGFSPIELIFARVSHLAAPPPALTAEIQRFPALDDPSERMRNIALLFQTVVKPCPAAAHVFNQLGGVAPNEKVGILASELAPALARCHCAADPADVMQLVWLFLQPSPDGIIRRSFNGARIVVPPAGAPAVVIRAKKNATWDATWAKVSQRVLDAAKRGAEPPALRFEVGSR